MFAGLISFNNKYSPEQLFSPDTVRTSLSPYRTPDSDGYWQTDSACLLEIRTHISSRNRDSVLPLRCHETGVVLSFWGRIDNRKELADKLGLDAHTLARHTDAQLVLEGWRVWQESLPEYLIGDFAIAVIDPKRNYAFLARDPIGVKPLYYRLDANVFAFASSAAALKTLKKLPLTPDQEWMACYLWFLSKSHDKTAYSEIFKLPPGHTLTVDQYGNQQLKKWHHWRDDAPWADKRDERWVSEYREVLEEVIRCRMESDYPLGTENSGGLDSATITAFLAHFMGDTPGDKLHTFGYALCEQEPGNILETSQARGIVHNYIITARHNIVPPHYIDRGLKVLGYPEEHSMATYLMPFYVECERRNIRTLFSGFGGDEVVTSHARQLRFELLDRGNYKLLWELQSGNLITRSLRLAKAITLGYKNPIYRPTYFKTWHERWQHQLLREEIVNKYNVYQRYIGTACYDAPYRSVNQFILQHLFVQPFIATRLENCTLLAASYGIEYSWPLFDVRLIQQYLSTPAIEKCGPMGIGRFLHRRAIEDVVPKKIALKPSKDIGFHQVVERLDKYGITEIASIARNLHAELPPELTNLLEINKLQHQIERAAQGNADKDFSFAFRSTIKAMLWLNSWISNIKPSATH